MKKFITVLAIVLFVALIGYIVWSKIQSANDMSKFVTDVFYN